MQQNACYATLQTRFCVFGTRFGSPARKGRT
jgi:hypothetical protein